MSDLQCKIIQQASDLSFDNNNHPVDQYLQIWTPITINNRLFTMILSEHVSTCNEMPKDVITSRIGGRLTEWVTTIVGFLKSQGLSP